VLVVRYIRVFWRVDSVEIKWSLRLVVRLGFQGFMLLNAMCLWGKVALKVFGLLNYLSLSVLDLLFTKGNISLVFKFSSS